MKIGYARVSTEDQDLGVQIDALQAAGCERIYSEKVSGRDMDSRPQLQAMLAALREGDTVIVLRLDRLGRTTKHLLDLVDHFKSKGVGFRSINDDINTESAMGSLVFTMFAAFAEFERSMTSERTKAHLARARERGIVGGRKPKLDAAQRRRVVEMYEAGTLQTIEIAKHFDVTRQTIYRVLREAKAKAEAKAAKRAANDAGVG